MRIIAGEAGSRRLVAPPGLETRPTADKVREALFNILTPRVYNARVLDLYAGSGALALEALSRGAGSAVLADKDKGAAKAIGQNIRTLGYADRARFLPVPDVSALRTLHLEGAAFDLVLLDPPYRYDLAPILQSLLDLRLLAPDALIVAEHRWETPPVSPPSLALSDKRRYGITGLSFYKKGGD